MTTAARRPHNGVSGDDEETIQGNHQPPVRPTMPVDTPATFAPEMQTQSNAPYQQQRKNNKP